MYKAVLSLILLSITLASCSVETGDAESSKTYDVIDLSDAWKYDGYVVDKRTSCLYIVSDGQSSSHMSPVYNKSGESVVCGDFSLERYFKEGGNK